MLKINNNWEFTPEWSDEFLRFETAAEPVRLPHNVGTQMLHYSSPADFTGRVGYRTRLHIPEEYRGKRLFLQFDGAAHIATLYCNNQVIAGHNTGYTAFRAEIVPPWTRTEFFTMARPSPVPPSRRLRPPSSR